MPIYGPLFSLVYNREWSFWGDHVWPLVSCVVRERAPDARTWLDLCCGTGSLLRLVTDVGYEATGVDLSPHQLAHARASAPSAELIEADIRTLDLGRQFDVITCMFDSLNYLVEPDDLDQALTRVAQHLGPGGLFIFDTNTYEGLKVHWKRTSAIRADDHVVIVETSFNEDTAIGRVLITGFVREGDLYRKFEEEHIERGFTPDEMQGILTRHGFGWERYDGNSLEEAEEDATRLLYVCRQA